VRTIFGPSALRDGAPGGRTRAAGLLTTREQKCYSIGRVSTLERRVLIWVSKMLTARRRSVLKIIVGEYIDTALPVGSSSIVRKYNLAISPATIRNDMAELETEGYITHPHTSAGRVPSDKGYRYYVEFLMDDASLPPAEQHMIRHQFHQVESDLEQWSRLAAAVLAQAARNASLVSLAKAREARFKHLHLFPIQDDRAMVVLLLQEGLLKQQLVSLSEPVNTEELARIAHRINDLFAGLSARDIQRLSVVFAKAESDIADVVLRVMRAHDSHQYEDLRLDGLRHILAQPEFSSNPKLRAILDVLEESTLKTILSDWLVADDIEIVIGEENQQGALHECSLVLARYGVPGSTAGVLGVLGPTRMNYARTVSVTRYLAALMSQLLTELQS